MEENSYVEVRIDCADEETRSLLVAAFADAGYEGFEETDTTLITYIPQTGFDAAVLDNLLRQFNVSASKSIIEKQNWNALWESNFEPVRVGDFAGIRAAFHPPFWDVAHELVITPKMSFGTGHHATTWQVIQMMESIDFRGRTVFDFGTGTGILAILAARLGAARVLAVDNDPWCIENAAENTALNQVSVVELRQADSAAGAGAFDIVIANINRNIILDNLKALGDAVNGEGRLLLSGLLASDEEEIVAAFTQQGFLHQKTTEKNGWIAICFKQGKSLSV